MNILWHYLFSIFQVATQYLRGFQPHGAPTTVQEKRKVFLLVKLNALTSVGTPDFSVGVRSASFVMKRRGALV